MGRSRPWRLPAHVKHWILKKLNLIIPPNAEPPDEAVEGEQHKKDVDDDQLGLIEGEGDFLELSTICVESKDGADNLLPTRRCSAQVQRRLPVGKGLHKIVAWHIHSMANGHACLLYACSGKKLVAREALSRQFVSVSESLRKKYRGMMGLCGRRRRLLNAP